MHGPAYLQMQKTVPTQTYTKLHLLRSRDIANAIKQLIRSFEQWLMADGFVCDGVRYVQKKI